MKKIAFNLSKDFHLHSITNNKIYELENDSTELVFSTVVDEAMVYELHVQTADDKFYKTLYKKQNYVGIMLSNSILAEAGKMTIQVKGIKEANEGEEVIISNAYELTVGSFINAKFQPTPAEEDEFEKLVVKVEAIDSRVTHIISELGELASDLEAEKTERLETEAVFDRELKQEIEDRINAVNGLNTKVDENVAALGNAISEQGSIFSQAISSTAQSLNAEIEKKANTKDVYDKTAITALLSAKADLSIVNALDTTLRAEIAKKQDKLKAGANIHIDPVTNEISATGGGASDVTKDYVDNGFTSEANVKIDTRLNTNGGENVQAGYCVTDKLFIDGSKTITWYCGNHQTAAAYLVLFDSSDAKIQYFKMSKDNYVIDLSTYPTYSYLRATFYMEDTEHSTIVDNDGSVLFKVNMEGERVLGLLGLNDTAEDHEERIEALEQGGGGSGVTKEYVDEQNALQDQETEKIKADLSQLDTEVDNHETRIRAIEEGGGIGTVDYIARQGVAELKEDIEPLFEYGSAYLEPLKTFYEKAVYNVVAQGKFYYKTYSSTNVCVSIFRLKAGIKYKIVGTSLNGALDVWAISNDYFEPPTSGYGTGVVYTSYRTTTAQTIIVEDEITPTEDCYLYLQNYILRTPIETAVEGSVIVPKTDRLEQEVLDLSNDIDTLKNSLSNRIEIQKNGTEYLLATKYDNSHDIIYKLCQHSVNNLFDFYAFYIFENEDLLPKVQTPTSDKLVLWGDGDWHAPYQIEVVNNADGDALGSQYFTGGMHGYKNATTNASATARCLGVKCFIDGKELDTSYRGYANEITIYWENMVQAYNTMKIDGSGREVLKECHWLVFDGVKFKSHTEFMPLEDIHIPLWYGLQMIYSNGGNRTVRYVDGTNRVSYPINVASECGDNKTSIARVFNDSNNLTQELSINTDYDLGKRDKCYSNLTKAMFGATYGKCYATIINNGSLVFNANCIYSLDGIYKFYKYPTL